MIRTLFFFLLLFYIPNLKAAESTIWNITHASKNKYYQIDLKCAHPPTLSGFQNCWFTLSNKTKTISNAKVFIEGGMPAHQHGLPTAPNVSWNYMNKLYTINGLKFSMPGAWQLSFLIDKINDTPRDIITINFDIE